MPSKKTPFPKNFATISIIYGLISFALMVLLTLSFFYILGSGNSPVISWNYSILIVAMFLGIKTYQQKIIKGNISFKEAYVSGVFVGITASIFFSFFMIFYSKYIDVEFIKNFVSENTIINNKKVSIEEIKQLQQQIQSISPIEIGIYAFGQLLLLSLFLPLLIYIFFKHKKNSDNEQ